MMKMMKKMIVLMARGCGIVLVDMVMFYLWRMMSVRGEINPHRNE